MSKLILNVWRQIEDKSSSRSSKRIIVIGAGTIAGHILCRTLTIDLNIPEEIVPEIARQLGVGNDSIGIMEHGIDAWKDLACVCAALGISEYVTV